MVSFVVNTDNKCYVVTDMPIPLPVRTARSGWPFYFRGIEKITLQHRPGEFFPLSQKPHDSPLL